MYDLAPLSVGACLNVNEKKIKTIKKPRESGAFPLTADEGQGRPWLRAVKYYYANQKKLLVGMVFIFA